MVKKAKGRIGTPWWNTAARLFGAIFLFFYTLGTFTTVENLGVFHLGDVPDAMLYISLLLLGGDLITENIRSIVITKGKGVELNLQEREDENKQ